MKNRNGLARMKRRTGLVRREAGRTGHRTASPAAVITGEGLSRGCVSVALTVPHWKIAATSLAACITADSIFAAQTPNVNELFGYFRDSPLVAGSSHFLR